MEKACHVIKPFAKKRGGRDVNEARLLMKVCRWTSSTVFYPPQSMCVHAARTALLLHAAIRVPRACFVAKWLQSRQLATIPLRKHLKDEAKRKKTEAKAKSVNGSPQARFNSTLEKWELTVGIEIHAELNTACKLFSSGQASVGDDNGIPNSRVAHFDAALPGAQPQFQVATLLPALRAAIALGCDVQRKSGWDRKHYFHWDQPNGYQITQYYGGCKHGA